MGFIFRMIALSVLLMTTAAEARHEPWFPRKSGECGWVHGRYVVANGSGVRRVWVIGSQHILNLYDNDDGANPDDTTPPEFDSAWDMVLKKDLDSVYGDFFVYVAWNATFPGTCSTCIS